jgi:Uma2 family endonuclease
MDPRAQEGRVVSFAEAAKLDADLDAGELDQGRWVPVTRGTWRHGTVVVNIAVLLKQYARAAGGWSVAAADPGTKLARDPDVLRGPDVGIARADRVPTGTGAEGWLEGAPDVAVEVIGDAQSHSDLARKALEYLAAGASMVWVVDSDKERVVLYTPPDRVRVLGRDDLLDGADALPGFSARVSEFFE